MNSWLVPVAITMVLAAGGAQAAPTGDSGAGKTKSATCAACHNADGNSINPIWPKLAGQHTDYIYKQIMDFKSGVRQDPTMTAMVAPLTEQDAADLAAYFSAQTKSAGTTDPKLLALGERLYRGGNAESGVAACTACHQPNGSGNAAAKFPAINGQHATYVEKALKDFRAQTRGSDPSGSMMRGVAAHLTDSEIVAVAQYVQGLHD
jgi:cytochrome c553